MQLLIQPLLWKGMSCIEYSYILNRNLDQVIKIQKFTEDHIGIEFYVFHPFKIF